MHDKVNIMLLSICVSILYLIVFITVDYFSDIAFLKKVQEWCLYGAGD